MEKCWDTLKQRNNYSVVNAGNCPTEDMKGRNRVKTQTLWETMQPCIPAHYVNYCTIHQ